VTLDPSRRHRAGERIEDLCRACKAPREHVIVAVDADGTIAQVQCDFCGSRHRFRGGARAIAAFAAARVHGSDTMAPEARVSVGESVVSERERRFPVSEAPVDFEMILRRVIREETGLTPVTPADKWRGGDLVLRPGRPGLQEKSWPIETFFHKIVMVRNRLRVLEQQVNGLDVPDDLKLKLQGYITGCYGSLTSFNILFADEADKFRGGAAGE